MYKTMATRIWTGILLALLMVGLSLPANAQDKRIERSIDVSKGGTLELDVDWGDVEIETSSRSEATVLIEIELDGLDDDEIEDVLDNYDFEIEKRGNGLIVSSDFDDDVFDRSWRKWKNKDRFSVNITIEIPEDFDVEFRTGAGDVWLADLQGSVRGRTGAGTIMFGSIYGDVDISSGAGDIEIEHVDGDIEIDSGAGNITLESASGSLDVSTGAGNIRAKIYDSLTGNSQFDSGAGNVTVYLDENVGADVDAGSGIGSAKTDYDLRVRGKLMSKSFRGEVNGGGYHLSMESGVGNVTLRRL